MKRLIPLILLGIAILFPWHPAIAQYLLTNVNNGVTCQAINASQEPLLQWRAVGLINKSATEDVWVACPFISTRLTLGDPTGHVAYVDISNNGPADVTASCVYREVTGMGGVVRTISTSAVIPAAGFNELAIEPPELSDYRNSATVACLLPRSCQMNRIVQLIVTP